ncbi:MAG: DUF2017 family protein [Actinomycetota bacterium]
MSDEPVAPIARADDGGDGDPTWKISLGLDERAIVLRLLGEMRSLLRDDEPDDTAKNLLHRLFPPAFPDDEEKEAEYQRLMRTELVASRAATIDDVARVLGDDDNDTLNESEVVSFMQAVNATRVVLGTMLDVGEDDDIATLGDEATPEHHLYGYLSWLLDWTVTSLEGTT